MNSVKSSPMEKVAREVAARLRESGHIAYFAGGCVRDMVRRLIPKDYDIATDARPEALLRMLRALRFATVLTYQIDQKTWHALATNADSINQISAERIRDELVRIFLSPNRVRGWDLLDSSGLMRAILPELEAMKGVLQPEQFHPEGDVFVHTRLM